jgi:hypothetical protein
MECEQVKKQYPEVEYEPCCISCHEDEDMGYGEDLWFEIGWEDRHVCCAISRSFLKWRKKVDERS